MQSKTSRRTRESPRGSADESQEPGRRGGRGNGIVHGESGAAAHTNGTGNGGAVHGKGSSAATAARTGAALSHTQTHTRTAIQYSPGSAQVSVNEFVHAMMSDLFSLEHLLRGGGC